MNISKPSTSYFFNIPSVPLREITDLPGSDARVARCLIFRHGESAFNVANERGIKRSQGASPQVALTETGVAQAQELARQLKDKVQELRLVIATSSAVRAQRTADQLLQSLKCQEPDFISERFLEQSSNPYEGLWKDDPQYKEASRFYKNLSANEKFSSPKVLGGEAESPSQVAFRALRQIEDIFLLLSPKQTLVIFAHAQLMNALALSLSSIELSTESQTPLPDLKFANCDGMLIEFVRGEDGSLDVEKGRVKMAIRANFGGGDE